MKNILIILFIIFIWLWHPIGMRIPKGLVVFLGVPGSGKTSICSYMTSKFNHKYRKVQKSNPYKKRVYCNVPILGAYKINPQEDFGKYLIEDGMVIVDESGIEFNNRMYSKLSQDIVKWAKKFRHFGVEPLLMFSQGLDVDITFIRLSECVYIVKKSLIKGFVCVRRVKKQMDLDKVQHQLFDGFDYAFMGRHWIYVRPYWKNFDTYEKDDLPEREFVKWDSVCQYENKSLVKTCLSSFKAKIPNPTKRHEKRKNAV